MESTVVAPFAGKVASVDVAANAQVEAGAPLVRIRAEGTAAFAGPSANSRSTCRARRRARPRGPHPASGSSPRCAATCSATTSTRLLVSGCLPSSAGSGRSRRRTTPGLLPCEDGLLDLFADVGALYRPRTETQPDDALTAGSSQEYLLSLPAVARPRPGRAARRLRAALETALARYGVYGLERTPELDAAVVWMFRSFARVRRSCP